MGLPLLQPRRPSPRLEQARRSFAGGVRFPPVSFVCSLFLSFSRFGTLDQACHAADVLLIYHWLCCDGHHNKDEMRLYVRIRTGIVRFGLRTDRRRLSTHLNAQVPPAALSRSTSAFDPKRTLRLPRNKRSVACPSRRQVAKRRLWGREESEFWDTCSGASSSRFWEVWWLPGHLLRVRRNRCPGLAGLSTADQHWVPSISR